jgi:hypothetical protein
LKTAFLSLTLLFSLMVFSAEGRADLTAKEIIALAQKQLTVPSEFALGEMKVYRGERRHRRYSFVLGKLWDKKTQTEYVRIDFKVSIDSSLYADSRYLLKRTSLTPPMQWFYLPALHRVRIVPYQPDDPLLQSDYLFYDLTPIHNFGDYHYQFVDANKQAPVIKGRSPSPLVPYQESVFELKRRGATYLVTGIKYVVWDKEKQTRFSEFIKIAPGRFRPQKMVISGKRGRTELVFNRWVLSASKPRLFTPVHLETRILAIPEDHRGE